MNDGFLRVAACVPQVQVADCQENAGQIVDLARKVSDHGTSIAVFPEMSVTAYTCADLFHSSTLIDGAIQALRSIAHQTSGLDMLITVGAPIIVAGTLYNCAVAIHRGKIIAIVPKTYLPNYNEFYEQRWWASAPDGEPFDITLPGIDYTIPFGTRQLIDIGCAKIAIEICEDLWVPVPPSCNAALAGADLILNLSASDDLIGKYDYLTSLIAQQSARCLCAYAYASAGYGESSTDLVFDGKAIIAENGSILAANPRWQSGPQYSIADIDILALRRDRIHCGSFTQCARRQSPEKILSYRTICCPVAAHLHQPLMRRIAPLPFVPASDTAMHERCSEITNIQVAGLARRLQAIRCSKIVIGISGGLDSTLALLVAVATFRRLGLNPAGIIGITMPGFGTSGRTLSNSLRLMQQLGVTVRQISIASAVTQHFADIGHDPDIHDVTYENSQARERTQILMDVANQIGAIVLGTGDLSELALGWATYNGDHMSMYAVNCGVPKTLVRHLVRHFASQTSDPDLRATLLDIIDTPISPELIPADPSGNISQITEDLVGPYELHDFFLYYTLRYGFSPRRIFLLAKTAFSGTFTSDVILHWMRTFYRRFFSQQFKRSCLPDGPKVGSVCLSPRGDWRMPSDASPALWLKELDSLQ